LRIREARLACDEASFESAQSFASLRQRFVVSIQPQDLSIRTTLDQNLFAVPSASQCAVEISFARPGPETLDHLPDQHGDMRDHRSVTRPVTLPIVVEALDRVLERRIVFKEPIHADHFKDVTQEWTHAGQFEIAV
jgi:hypothetical protein